MTTLKVVIGLISTALFLYFAVRGVEIGQLYESILRTDYALLSLAIGVALTGYWVRAWRWRLILHPMKEVGVHDLFAATVIGFMANNVLPLRPGEVARAYVRILKPLAEAGYNVIVRPHRQSYISESELISSLQSGMAAYPNLSWDAAADGFHSMAAADVMLSDMSGVIFDFAFLFEKPVLTLKYELNKLGMEAFDIPWEPWELTMLDTIGEQIDESGLSSLPARLREIAGNDEWIKAIQKLRDGSVYNFGNGGPVAARQIPRIADRIAEGNV